MTSLPLAVVRFQVEGFHHWPGATGERAYLAQRHRHNFHIEAGIAVFTDDREIEFHDFLAFVKTAITQGQTGPIEFGAQSCEQIARSLINAIVDQWPGRRVVVSVFEDGEMGATLTRMPEAVTYEIAKEFHFSASHQLKGLPEDHPCARLHGHNYRVEIVLQSEQLDERGFVMDYGDLAPFKQFIDSTLDHRHLNDVLDVSPTAENLAKYLYEWAKARWPQTAAMRVSETPKTWAEYRP